MQVDLGWADLCARVREHARQLVGASAADLFLCDAGGRELISTMETAAGGADEALNAEASWLGHGGGGAGSGGGRASDEGLAGSGEGEETVRFKVAWLLQAGEDDAITLAALAVESGDTVVANSAPEQEEQAAGEGGAKVVGAAAQATPSSVEPVQPSSSAEHVPQSGVHGGGDEDEEEGGNVDSRAPLRPSRLAVVLRSATPGLAGALPAKVGVLVVERPVPFLPAEVEIFAELAQHLGGIAEVHRARWQALAELERTRAHAGRHALLLAAARDTLRTYATYDGVFEVAHGGAGPMGALELNLYIVRRLSAHEAAALPFAAGTAVLFSRVPAPEDRHAQPAGAQRRLIDVYAPVSGILGHVATTGLSVSTADAEIHPLFNAHVDQLSSGRVGDKEAIPLLVVPVRDSLNHVVGVLQCFGRRKRARAAGAPQLPAAFATGAGDGAFSAEDADFLEVSSCYLGYAWHLCDPEGAACLSPRPKCGMPLVRLGVARRGRGGKSSSLFLALPAPVPVFLTGGAHADRHCAARRRALPLRPSALPALSHFGSPAVDCAQAFAHHLSLQLLQVKLHAQAGIQVESVQEASIRLQGMARDAADAELASSREELSQGVGSFFEKEPAAAHTLLRTLPQSKLIRPETGASNGGSAAPTLGLSRSPSSRSHGSFRTLPPVSIHRALSQHATQAASRPALSRAPTMRVGGKPALPADALAQAAAARTLEQAAVSRPNTSHAVARRQGTASTFAGWPVNSSQSGRGAADEEAVWEDVFRDIRSL